MRKALKIYLGLSPTIYMISMFLIISMGISPNQTLIKIIVSVFALMLIVGLVFCTYILSSPYTTNWFKTIDEIEVKAKEVDALHQKYQNVLLILGRHEAIKLWEEAKLKQKENETTESVGNGMA